MRTWNDLLGVFPGLIGVKTGHTNDAGWCEVAAARRPGYTIYAVDPRQPDPRTAERRPAAAARLGRLAVPHADARRARSPTPGRRAPYGRRAVALVARRPLVRVVRVGRPLVERIVAPTAVSLPVTRGERLGRVEIWSGRTRLGTRPLLAARTIARPGLGGRLRWVGTRTVHHLLGLFS